MAPYSLLNGATLSILLLTRWVALMIQFEQQQHGEFVVGWVGWGGWVADTNYLYPARCGWINSSLGLDQHSIDFVLAAYAALLQLHH